MPQSAFGSRAANSPTPKTAIETACSQIKKRRFFPKRLEIDLRAHPIACREHLAGAFGEVDFVPIEEVNAAQKRNEKQRGEAKNQ